MRAGEAAPEPPAFPSEARGGPTFQREKIRPPPLERSVAAIPGYQEQLASSFTHGLLRGNAAVSGARRVTSVRVRALAAGPAPGGGDERRSKAGKNSCLSMTATERPATAHISLKR